MRDYYYVLCQLRFVNGFWKSGNIGFFLFEANDVTPAEIMWYQGQYHRIMSADEIGTEQKKVIRSSFVGS